MNRRQNAVIFSRKYTKKNGKSSTWYWYYIYDDTGKRKAYPLYTQSKAEAKLILDEKKASGELVLCQNSAGFPYLSLAKDFNRSIRYRGQRSDSGVQYTQSRTNL